MDNSGTKLKEEIPKKKRKNIPFVFSKDDRGIRDSAAHTVIKNHVSPLRATLSTDRKHKSSPDRMIDVYLIETQLYKDDVE